MKKGFLVAFIMLFISMPVFAATVYNPVVEDTFVVETDGIIGFDISGNVNLSAGFNYGDYNETAVFVIKSGGLDTDIRSLWKFNNSAFQSRLIDSLVLSYDNAEFDCGTSSFSAYWTADDSWQEMNVTFNTKPVLDTAQRLTGINRTGQTNQLVIQDGAAQGIANSSELFALSSFAAANAYLMDDIYNGAQTTIQTDKTGGSCGAVVGNKYTIFSRERIGSVINVSMRANLVDYITAFVQGTDTTNTYFDFETGFSSASAFPQADFVYNAANNTLTPLVPAAIATFSESNDNNLAEVVCGGFAPFSTTNILSTNVPAGEYDIYCFDLQTEHNGIQFYGAIKVINNTDVRSGIDPEFDFYYAVYSPNLVSFSPATFTPSPPQANLNLSVSWTTTNNISTGLRFRYSQNGIMSAWASIENASLSLQHTAVIPSNFMFQTFYEYQLYGSDNASNAYSSDVANFTAFDTFTTANVSVGNSTYFDFETGTFSTTAFNGADFRLTSANNGTLTPLSAASFITSELSEANTLQNLDCRLAPAYSNTERTQLISNLNSVFCFDLRSAHGGEDVFGAIKITAISDTAIEFYWAIYTPEFVTFFGVVKSPEPPQATRDLTISWQTSIPLSSQLQYSYRLVNETGYSGYRLLEDAAIVSNHALTIPASQMFLGDYQFFFAGVDSSNVTTYTSTAFNFTVVNQSSGGAVSNPVATFFGISVEAALIVIALIITIGGTVLVQLKAKSPAVSAMTFMTGLLIFTAMNWLPIIFALVLGIMAVFVAMKLIADSVAGQQGF